MYLLRRLQEPNYEYNILCKIVLVVENFVKYIQCKFDVIQDRDISPVVNKRTLHDQSRQVEIFMRGGVGLIKYFIKNKQQQKRVITIFLSLPAN